MLGSRDVTATIAVSDIDRARRFYEETLGLKRVPTGEPDTLVFRRGSSTILVYQSEYAGSNQATALTWVVGDDLEKEAAALKAQGDVHVFDGTRAAWFMDADGNILALVSR